MAGPANITDRRVATEEPAQLHDLLPFGIRDHLFAVFTDQVDSTADAKPFAHLPRTPSAIVGVVCVRGRMLTVIDPAAILNQPTNNWEQTLPYVLVIRGDEQIALVAESCRNTITISADDIDTATSSTSASDPAVGIVRYAGEEILILDAERLFRRAIQRRERRRRRF